MGIKVTHNTPGNNYIAYREENTSDQVTISEAEIDARAESDQRAAWELQEATIEGHHADQGRVYERRPFEGFSPPSSQTVRERYAALIAAEKFGE